MPQVPILTAQSMSPDQTVSISVYDVNTGNSEEALYYISNTLGNYGMSVEFQTQGNQVYGNTYSDVGTFRWVGKTLRKNGGTRVVTVGSMDYLFQQNSNVINQVFNSIR